MLNFFFFQAEDGIRDIGVTGVQTCALPILYAFAPVGRPIGVGQTHVTLATDGHAKGTVAEHFYADEFSLGATDVLFVDLSVDVGYLIHVQFTCQDHHIGETCVELQGVYVRYIELGREVNLNAHLVAIGHHGHVAGDNGRYVGLFGGVNYLVHRGDVLTVADGIYRKIGLNVMFGAGSGYLPQVVNGEMIGRVRPHIELANAEIHRVGTGLNGGGEAFA